MTVKLINVNRENWIECLFLTTNTDDHHPILERFVASNAVSLAQSKVENGWTTKAIYNESNQMVGFTMYGYSEKNKFYQICRIMIDHKFQKRGYGSQALQMVISELKQEPACNEIFLSIHPENRVARELYLKFGFIDTGEILDDEILFKLTVK